MGAALVLMVVPAGAEASFGHVDRSFGSNGLARPDLGPTFANAMFGALVAEPDGAVLGTRSVAPYPPKPQLRRYLANGQLDPGFPPRDAPPGFGEDGRGLPIAVRKSVPLPGGKTLLAGVATYFSSAKAPPINQVGVMRLNADGSPDPSFDGDGLVLLRSAHGIVGQNVGALDARADEGVLVAVNTTERLAGFGETQRSAVDAATTLAALTGSGSLELGFGDQGLVRRNGSLAGIHPLPKGGVLVAGSKRSEPAGCCYAQNDFWLGRYTPAGAPDPSFGNGGEATADLGGIDLAETVLWEDDGSTLLGGASMAPTPICVQLFACEETPALARFGPDGGLDPGFGDDGRTRLPSLAARVPHPSKGVLSLAARPGGGVFAGGGSGPDAFIAALDSSGGLDPGFGGNGIVAEREPLPSRSYAEAAAVDPQGRILVAGQSEAGTTGSYPDGALVRYLPDGGLDPGFGDGRGYVEVPIEASDLAIDEGERTVLLGEGGRMLTRVLSDGSIDLSFGEGGIAQPAAQLGLGRLGFSSLAALPGGGTLLAGQVLISGALRIAVVRLDPAGAVDRSFADGGIAVRGLGRGRPCGASKVLVQPDGRILLAGYVGKHGRERRENSGFALMRLLPDGSLDPSFGRGGRLPGRVGRISEATDLALAGRRILAAGWLRRNGRFTTLVLRYRLDGHRDRGFGHRGVARATIRAKAAVWQQATSLVPTPRRIVVFRGTSARPLLAFRRDGRLDRTFAGSAKLTPHRIAEGWAPPNPLLVSQAGAPVLVWTDWEPSGGGGRSRAIALRRLLPR